MTSRVLHTALSLFLTSGIASAGIFSRKKPTELAVRTTAYTHSESDHLKYGRKTAAGGTLKYGKSYSSAAADWSKFPLGTKFKIDGMNTTFVVDDYGSALVGTETIDIYKPSRSAMNQWGVKHVDIKILEYGDFDRSREILEDRTKYAHVRKMLAGIDKNPGPKPQKNTKSDSDSDKKPFFLFSRKADPTPEVQLASSPPAPKPAPVPSPAPVEPAVSTTPKIPAPPIPAPALASSSPAPESTPQIVATVATVATAPSAAPKPETQPAMAPEAAPIPAPGPSPLLAPAPRKVKPLQLAAVTGSPQSAEPAASEAPAHEKPNAPANQPRKREFRPLIASVNG